MFRQKVLVVEDVKKQNKILCDIVNSFGYRALSAYNGFEAFEQMQKNRRGLGFLTNSISCILLDWQMPKMRGEHFLQTLRRLEHWRSYCLHTPVVIVTGYDSDERRRLSKDHDGMVCGYITKPYDQKEIGDILKKVVDDGDWPTMIDIYAGRWRSFF